MGLQFSWIEANLLGFFLVDVRSSRGKFDEIKEKFVINPAPIASQSSLNAGGTRWTRDLPRNSLNFFTSRSKVEEQRRSTWVFKEGNWPEIVGDGGGRGGNLQASLERFHFHGFVASNPHQFWPDFTVDKLPTSTILAPRFGPRSSHDRVTIRLRSWS